MFRFLVCGLILALTTATVFANDTVNDIGENQETCAQESNVVYINGASGNDEFVGGKPEEAVKTFERAKEIAAGFDGAGKILVTGKVLAEGEMSLGDLTNSVFVERAEGYEGELFEVEEGKRASFSDIVVDGASRKCQKSLVKVFGTLDLNDGAVLRNNAITNRGDYTIGGGVSAVEAEVNLNGGIVENNEAVLGGGIYLQESNLNFHKGIVRKNRAYRIQNEGGFYCAGGGIIAYNGSIINMYDGALVSENYAQEIGGGISIGNNSWSPGNDTLNMYGGTVSGNVAGATGGGIFVQAGLFGHYSIAHISGGEIIGNGTDRTGWTASAFGGGGIYVNGYSERVHETAHNGELYIKDALITNNDANYQGGGYAACPISTTEMNCKDGAMIYENRAEGGGNDGFILSSNNYGRHSGNAQYKLADKMMDGTKYQWKVTTANMKDGKLTSEMLETSELSLDDHFLMLETDKKPRHAKAAKVVITDNWTHSRGGGIGSNGTVTFGEDGPLDFPEEPEEPEVKPEKPEVAPPPSDDTTNSDVAPEPGIPEVPSDSKKPGTNIPVIEDVPKAEVPTEESSNKTTDEKENKDSEDKEGLTNDPKAPQGPKDKGNSPKAPGEKQDLPNTGGKTGLSEDEISLESKGKMEQDKHPSTGDEHRSMGIFLTIIAISAFAYGILASLKRKNEA